MGVIQKQTIKGSIFSYLGVVIGFITTGLLFPKYFSVEENGLIKLLVSYSIIFAQFASLGFNRVITMLFTYFRDFKNKHNGFLFITAIVILIGFVLAIIVFLLLKTYILGKGTEKSLLFADYFYYIIPLIFVTLLFTVLDNYNKVLFNAVRGIFLKEFFQRIIILLDVILFYFGFVNFQLFVIIYIIAFSLPPLIIMVLLIKEGNFNLRPQINFITKDLRSKMINISIFGVLTSFSGILILNIDTVMINSMLGIGQTGVYAITFFFGSIILIPSRSLIKISSVVIADAWKGNNLKIINDIYYKSCLNQLIFASLLFVGIWANINNVFEILPTEYATGKYVIFFIALSSLIKMAGGVNNMILFTSKYYKIHTLFILIFVVVIVISNLIFIPMYGIVGAALASALSNFIFMLIEFIFLKVKFKFQPYNYKFLLVLAISGFAYLISYFVPIFNNYIIDIIVRSLLITIIFVGLILIFKLSEDIDLKAKQIINLIKK
ncbi:MAG: lipopolysaccharide biosynthesis protein [Bacteroidales bacterium]|nr:lipopolysaccharide biosynthesis protein [Bacteroidales bacterium]